jgi:hypothetical protein
MLKYSILPARLFPIIPHYISLGESEVCLSCCIVGMAPMARLDIGDRRSLHLFESP